MKKRAKNSGNSSFLRTITYFIPAPPKRKSGYREREFDKIMSGILSSGYTLEQIQMTSVSGDQPGVFILAVIKAKSIKIFMNDETQDLHEKFQLNQTHDSEFVFETEDET